MAAEVPAKKLRFSEEESEPWTNQEPGFINLRIDVSKYSHCSLNIETMSHEELLQIFNIGVAVKESFTLAILENSSFVKEELEKQIKPIYEEMSNLPRTVGNDMLQIRKVIGESLMENNTEMTRRVDDLKRNLVDNINSVSNKVLPVAEMERRISGNFQQMETRTNHRFQEIAGKVDRLAQEYQKPAKKGIVSENTVMSTLKKNIPNYTFNDVSREKGKGDIRVYTPEGRQFLIEVKNYQANVPKTEIEKFKSNVLSDEVKVGIMLSVRSGIAMKSKHGKFEVNHLDGKYLIYVPSALTQPEVTIWSVFLANELAGLDVELKENQAKKLQKLCESFQEKVKYVERCREKINILNNAIKGLEESIEPIFEIIQDAGKKLKAILKDSSKTVQHTASSSAQPQPFVIDLIQ